MQELTFNLLLTLTIVFAVAWIYCFFMMIVLEHKVVKLQETLNSNNNLRIATGISSQIENSDIENQHRIVDTLAVA